MTYAWETFNRPDGRRRLRTRPLLDEVLAVLENPDAGGGYFTVTEVHEWLNCRASRPTITNRLDELTRTGVAVCELRPVGARNQRILTYRAAGPELGDAAEAVTR